MGRKRKQVDVDGANKTTLPPCRVCDAPGAGFHYGANTCEACKGFFHRSLKLSPQYKCDGDGNCIIEHGQDKLCQACRYKKCLDVGMAKSAIKTGRYTSMKRTNDILEIKRLQGIKSGRGTQKNVKDKILQFLDSGSENSTDSTSLSSRDRDPASTPSLPGTSSISSVSPGQALSDISMDTNCKTCQDLTDTKDHGLLACVENLIGSCSSSSMQKMDLLPQESTQHRRSNNLLTPPPVPSPMYYSPHSDLSTDSYSTTPSSSLLNDVASSLLSLSLPHSNSSKSSSSSSTSSSLAPCCQDFPSSLHSPASYSSLTSPASSMLSPSSCLANSSPCANEPQATSSLIAENDPKILWAGTLCESCGCSVHDSTKTIEELYQDQDAVIQLLLEAYKTFLEPLHGRMTLEEMRESQKEHIEECKLRQEMFGQLKRLPDQEYDYIYATTGLDMDDRQKRLHKVGVALEANIRGMVKFAKIIPGFSTLDISDKVNLIKYSRQEFSLLGLSEYMNYDLKIIRGMDGQWKCENELIGFVSQDKELQDFVDSHFQFNRTLQNLHLTNAERVLCQAIIIMGPDRDPPVISEQAREIYWRLNECLIHALSKRISAPLQLYAKVIDRITEARSHTENSLRFFRKTGLEKYSNIMENPLLREMCAGILFDYKDEESTDVFR